MYENAYSSQQSILTIKLPHSNSGKPIANYSSTFYLTTNNPFIMYMAISTINCLWIPLGLFSSIS